MSGLGKVILVSIGKENLYFNSNSSITYFKKNFRDYCVNITNEILPQYFKSSPTFGKRLSTKIAKNSDLIKDITVYFELPDIQPSQHSSLPENIKKFAWTNKIAFAMIKYIDIEIGGILVSRHYGDWLNIQYETTKTQDYGWEKEIGKNVTILTDYTNGKSSYKLYIPLSFFFNNEVDIGFPLISISKQEIEIHVELNDFDQCYKETPTNYFEIDSYVCLYIKDEIIKQNVDGVKSAGQFVYFDINTKRVYYNKLYNDFLINTVDNLKYLITGKISGFSIQPKVNTIIITDENYFPSIYPALKEAFVLVNYVYLDSNERWYFSNNDLEYIIPLVSNVLEKNINSINSNYNLKLVNPHKVLYWRAQLNSNLYINDVFNYSSLPYTDNEEPLIQSNKLLINSIARNEIYNNEYYERLQPYLNNCYSTKNINMFSFGFNPLNYNPAGTMNFSKVDDAIIQMNLNKIINYNNSINIRAYGVYYNIMVIKNGNSSLKYYL
jgi:hypothetical protein